MYYYELEWTADFKKIWNILLKYYISLPSIIDDNSTSKLPTVFKNIQEAYENPYNPSRYDYHFQQLLWFDRITNPTPEMQELLALLDKYKIRHSVNFFHMSAGTQGVTSEFLPHRHMPGGVVRGTDSNMENTVEEVVEGSTGGKYKTVIETTHVQFTFPFINSSHGETHWSSVYDVPFKERRRFLESEITGRYTLGENPVLFDVASWHQGKNIVNEEDRLLVGLPTDYFSMPEAVENILRVQQS